jgi:hypothetical protein
LTPRPRRLLKRRERARILALIREKHYFWMVESRYMSVLSSFSAEEMAEGSKIGWRSWRRKS